MDPVLCVFVCVCMCCVCGALASSPNTDCKSPGGQYFRVVERWQKASMRRTLCVRAPLKLCACACVRAYVRGAGW